MPYHSRNMKRSALITALLISSFAAAGCGSAWVNVNVNTNSNSASSPAVEATPASGSAESQNLAARDVVADLYKQHDAQKGPFFQTKDRSLVDKYFTKPIADLIWKDATIAGNEVGAIDGDPLYNAQDIEIKNFAVGEAAIKGETATVPVTFTNFGEKQAITFAMKHVDKAWKIDNILYGGKDSLLSWLKATYPAGGSTASSGEFEGKYIVGDTSCTVKPAKMSFEVRWAKGSGVEMFFFKEGTTFESQADGRVNQFVFDDENYDSGTFYRADGKTFPIKRAK